MYSCPGNIYKESRKQFSVCDILQWTATDYY